ncbi:MAG: Flp pilus assembly protein CpaB [Actinomycetota bacterium]|nr:Flp pilus assembly protein CpaB [Actinomycetota bacterium]
MENLAPNRLLKTRQGTIVIGVAAAVLAAILLLVYLSHYRNSVRGSTEPVTVLVAKSLIPKGTSGTAIATRNLFVVTTIPKGQLKLGAISDSAVLNGTIAAADIYPRQQLTTADFTAASVGALAAQLSGNWRAVGLPALDPAHGLAPDIQAGDHVDVYAQLNGTMGLVLSNVLVLASPTQAAAGSTAPITGSYILRVPTAKAPRFAYVGQNGAFWLVLRPGHGAAATQPAFVTASNALLHRGEH